MPLKITTPLPAPQAKKRNTTREQATRERRAVAAARAPAPDPVVADLCSTFNSAAVRRGTSSEHEQHRHWACHLGGVTDAQLQLYTSRLL